MQLIEEDAQHNNVHTLYNCSSCTVPVTKVCMRYLFQTHSKESNRQEQCTEIQLSMCLSLVLITTLMKTIKEASVKGAKRKVQEGV